MDDAPVKSVPRPAADDVFDTADLSRDLVRRSARGGAAVVAGQAAVFLIMLGSTPVLARLLTPEDYGLLAMVAAVTAFISCFKDLGLPQATIQRESITHTQISTLFWLNVVVGASAGVLVAALAYPVAWFYGRPQLVGITVCLSPCFVLAGLAAQHQALLRRRMRFGLLAIVQASASLVAATTAIVAAALGAQYWALVLLQVTAAGATTAGVWLCCRWLPGRPVRGAGVGPMVRFGAYLAGGNILTAAARNVDKLLIGRFYGDNAVGLYSKASLLLLLPISQICQPITGVAVPALSRLQGEPERFRAMFRRGTEVLAMIVAPIPIFAFFAAGPIVRVLLGEKWLGAIPISRALAPAALAVALGPSLHWVFVALGRTDREFRWLLITSVGVLGAFVGGLQWGALGVATLYSVVVWATFVPGVLYCIHGTIVRFVDYVEPIWRPSVAALVAGAVLPFLERGVLAGVHPLLELASVGVVFGVLHCVVLLILPGGYASVRSMLELRRHFGPQSGPSA